MQLDNGYFFTFRDMMAATKNRKNIGTLEI